MARIAIADVAKGSVLPLPTHFLQRFAQQFGSPLVELIDSFGDLWYAVVDANQKGVHVALGSAAEASRHLHGGEQAAVKFSSGISRENIPNDNLPKLLMSGARAVLLQLRPFRHGRARGLTLPEHRLPASSEKIDEILDAYEAGEIAYAEAQMLEIVSHPSMHWTRYYDENIRQTWRDYIAEGGSSLE